MKKIFSVALGLLAVISLSACGKQLSTSKTTYKATGMVAVIKGDANGHQRVHYDAPTATGSAKVNSGKFVITVPMSTKAQTVKLSADSQKRQVTVKKAEPISSYQQFAKTFNQAVVATALPASVQKQLQQAATKKAPTAAAVASMPPAQQAAYAKQQQALQAEMVKAQSATKDRQLPTTISGLKQALATDGGKVRVNVQNGQLISATDVVSVKALKTKSGKAAFGTQFGLLVNATGADAKKVGNAFSKQVKDAKSGSTTTKTIRDHGVKFNLGLSADHLYIYMTK
ncbi:hypothetical protein [Lacticaseibacillus sp. GG6-2]